jgi:hypothetical protein
MNSKNLGGCNIWQVERPISSEMSRVLRHARLLSRVCCDRRAMNSHEVYLISAVLRKSRMFKLAMQKGIPNELRCILLVVAVLYLTINFQLVLTPPGGLWQDNCDPDQHNPDGCTVPHQAGKLIMGEHYFHLLYKLNSISFGVTIGLLIILLPWNSLLSLFFLIPMFLLFACYFLSIQIVTPSSFINKNI